MMKYVWNVMIGIVEGSIWTGGNAKEEKYTCEINSVFLVMGEKPLDGKIVDLVNELSKVSGCKVNT